MALYPIMKAPPKTPPLPPRRVLWPEPQQQLYPQPRPGSPLRLNWTASKNSITPPRVDASAGASVAYEPLPEPVILATGNANVCEAIVACSPPPPLLAVATSGQAESKLAIGDADSTSMLATGNADSPYPTVEDCYHEPALGLQPPGPPYVANINVVDFDYDGGDNLLIRDNILASTSVPLPYEGASSGNEIRQLVAAWAAVATTSYDDGEYWRILAITCRKYDAVSEVRRRSRNPPWRPRGRKWWRWKSHAEFAADPWGSMYIEIDKVESSELECNRLLAIRRVNEPHTPHPLNCYAYDKYGLAVTSQYESLCVDSQRTLQIKVHEEAHTFYWSDLTDVQKNAAGKPVNWISWMHHDALAAGFYLADLYKDDRAAGHWRLWEKMPNIVDPAVVYTDEMIQKEKGPKGYPAYIKDLFLRHAGEVAFCYGNEVWVDGPPPNLAAVWHPQFARNVWDRDVLRQLEETEVIHKTEPEGYDKFQHTAIPRLQAIGRTTLIRLAKDGSGYWRMDKGGVTTLASLFATHGEHFTAYDIMYWYTHATKLVKVRDHPKGTCDHQAACDERYRGWSHWGHRDGNRRPWSER